MLAFINFCSTGPLHALPFTREFRDHYHCLLALLQSDTSFLNFTKHLGCLHVPFTTNFRKQYWVLLLYPALTLPFIILDKASHLSVLHSTADSGEHYHFSYKVCIHLLYFLS